MLVPLMIDPAVSLAMPMDTMDLPGATTSTQVPRLLNVLRASSWSTARKMTHRVSCIYQMLRIAASPPVLTIQRSDGENQIKVGPHLRPL